MGEIMRIGLFALLAFGCGQRTVTPSVSGEQNESVADSSPEPAVTEEAVDVTPQKAPSATPVFDPTSPLGPAPTDEERAAQLRCQKRSDCVLVPGICDGWSPANQEHAEKVSQRNQQLAARARCAPSKTPPSTPICTDGVCGVVELEWPELRACESPDDCIAIKGVCSGWNVVAKAHQSDAAERIAKMAAVVRCKAGPPGPAPSPLCRGRFCVPF